MLPPVVIPILSRVNTFLVSTITLLFAFGVRVLSGENSNPWLITWVPSTLPISSAFTVNTEFTPSLVPIDVIIGKSLTWNPLFKTSIEWIPPISLIDDVE